MLPREETANWWNGWCLLIKEKSMKLLARPLNIFVGISKRSLKSLRLILICTLIVKAWEAGYDSILWNAPVLVVASAPKEASTGMVDLCIALSYLDLLAPTMGLGTCWAGLLQHAIISSPPLKEFLGVPAEHPHLFPMILGYPKARYYRLPGRKPPKITFG